MKCISDITINLFPTLLFVTINPIKFKLVSSHISEFNLRYLNLQSDISILWLLWHIKSCYLASSQSFKIPSRRQKFTDGNPPYNSLIQHHVKNSGLLLPLLVFSIPYSYRSTIIRMIYNWFFWRVISERFFSFTTTALSYVNLNPIKWIKKEICKK